MDVTQRDIVAPGLFPCVITFDGLTHISVVLLAILLQFGLAHIPIIYVLGLWAVENEALVALRGGSEDLLLGVVGMAVVSGTGSDVIALNRGKTFALHTLSPRGLTRCSCPCASVLTREHRLDAMLAHKHGEFITVVPVFLVAGVTFPETLEVAVQAICVVVAHRFMLINMY